jgi:hypothetical protein
MRQRRGQEAAVTCGPRTPPGAGDRHPQGRVRARTADQGRTRPAGRPGAGVADVCGAGRPHRRNPAGLATGQPPTPARAQGGQPVLRPGRVAAAATVLYAGVWVYAILFPKGGDNDTDGELIFFGGFVYLMILAICVGQMAAWGEKRSSGQSPRRPAAGAGGQALRRLPSADPDRQLPAADPGPRHAAEAARRRLLRPALPGLPPLRWRPRQLLTATAPIARR